jgi:cold shock CspA family protein
MSNEYQAQACQRCGIGFTVTPNYRGFLARCGAKVIVPVLCPRCFFKVGPLPKQRGRVKWFSPRKQYGFIITERGEEAFFHRNQLCAGSGDRPHEGQRVRFHIHHAIKGPEALNVELAGDRSER